MSETKYSERASEGTFEWNMSFDFGNNCIQEVQTFHWNDKTYAVNAPFKNDITILYTKVVFGNTLAVCFCKRQFNILVVNPDLINSAFFHEDFAAAPCELFELRGEHFILPQKGVQ